MNTYDSNALTPAFGNGGNPFETIRHVDAYGREYWLGRELMPLMDYTRWQGFAPVIKKARDSLALVEGDAAADRTFAQVSQLTDACNLGHQARSDYRLTRFGAYLTAMAGDDTKEAVAQARIYFVVKAREAEITTLSVESIQQTALARAREMVDYRTFRDMMAENAPDYVPSSKATGMFFAKVQNKLYRSLTGMGAQEIREARPLSTWPGRAEGKPEPSEKSSARKVAKNYLTDLELAKLNRMVGRLCLRAEDIADDGVHLTLLQWEYLVDVELATSTRQIAA